MRGAVVELRLSNASVVVVPGAVVPGGSGAAACGSAILSARYTTTISPEEDRQLYFSAPLLFTGPEK